MINLNKILPRRPSSSTFNAEESVPLTAVSDLDWDNGGAPDDFLPHHTASSTSTMGTDSRLAHKRHRKGRSCPSGGHASWTRWAVVGLTGYAAYRLVDFTYSNPERWSRSWADSLNGPKAVSIGNVVRAAGQNWRGTIDSTDLIVSWRGIRYAEPPTGQRRFRRAVPIKAPQRTEDEWATLDPVDANDWGDGCPRPANNRPGSEGHSGSEDCLTLNVFAPYKQIPDQLLPVMVWIHGGAFARCLGQGFRSLTMVISAGGFVSGSSNEEKYDPSDLLQRAIDNNQPIVFVSINYRLGALGFSATPPQPGDPPTPPHIPVRPPDDLDLNVGLKDQLEALHWINREIQNFGGDPNKVTLVGHSAGAMSVGLHQLYSPSHLFRGVFLLSGAPTSQCPSPEQQEYGPPSNSKLLDCLRQLDLGDFMKATKVLSDRSPTNGWFPWYPVLEGEWEGSWLNVRPSERIVRGTYSKVPVVMGTTLDEGTRFTSPLVTSQNDIKESLRGIFDFTFGAVEDLLEPIWEFYPDDPVVGSPFYTGSEMFNLSSSYKRQSALVGDLLFQAPRRHFLRETPKDLGEPGWNYLFTEPRAGAEPHMGSQHAADLEHWFAHPNSTDKEMHHLSRHMSSYLINFVANLDPNGPGLKHWPMYGTERLTMQFQRFNETVVRDNDRLEAMRFININNPMFAR
ncbi:hypothetical protein OIV83_005413 [Microbotryomycetes sp. JL201]|nr:hypothetical protein OIV83_005413 [Microbotryomycetes sp. JL201]